MKKSSSGEKSGVIAKLSVALLLYRRSIHHFIAWNGKRDIIIVDMSYKSVMRHSVIRLDSNIFVHTGQAYILVTVSIHT